jgi:hypothetical protein
MYISKGIIDLHQGKIGVFSKGLGFGTTFFVEFPRLMSTGSLDVIEAPRQLSTPVSSNNYFSDLAGK